MARVGNDKKPKKTDDRSVRLAAALRENLRRRKAQERERDEASETGTPPSDKNR